MAKTKIKRLNKLELRRMQEKLGLIDFLRVKHIKRKLKNEKTKQIS